MKSVPFIYRIFASKDGETILARKNDLAHKIHNVELELLQNWFEQIESVITVSMKRPLMIRNDGNLLNIDFDQEASQRT